MRNLKPQKQLLQLVMLALLSVVSVLVTSNESFAALNCSQCHGNNRTDAALDALPLDTPVGSPASYRNISTGAVKGNHQTHLSGLNISETNQFNCARCHNNSAYTSSHRSGTITLNKAINASPAATNYVGAGMSDSGTFLFKNQTSVPTLGTCSNVNCHFETVSLTWGSDPAAMGCGSCHAASPATFAHATHMATGTHATYSCNNCHAPRTTFQHATSAGNSGRNIDLKGTSMTGTGYSGSNFAYLPSQSATRAIGQCSTNYCHSSGQAFNGTTATPYSYSTPIWSGTAGCGTCHVSLGLNTGTHSKHIVATAGAGECGNCHTGATQATMVSTTHVDGSIDVSAGLAYSQGSSSARGNNYGTCSNTSCHSVYSPASSPAATWGTPAANCNFCHNGTAATIVSGAHTIHNNMGGVTCATCHTSNGALPGHINNNIDVSQGYPATIAKHAAGVYTATCSTVCHSTSTTAVGTPSWGAKATCSSCHATSPTTGAHTTHLTAVIGASCGTCHTGATIGVSGGPGHGNTLIDVAQYSAAVAKHADGTYTATCSTACHNAYSPTSAVTTTTWGVISTCATCHAASPVTGDHPKHIAATVLSGNLCGSCHTGATAGTTGGNAHGDGNVDIGGTLSGVTLTNITKHSAAGPYTTTCATTCHSAYPGTMTTPTWGSASTCGSCHFSSPTTGDHTKHIAAVTLGGNNCGACHTGATTTTYVSANHYDGNIDVGGTLTTASATNIAKHNAPFTTTCTTACHNAYSTSVGIATPAWGSARSCNSCHAAQPTTGDHSKHLRWPALLSGNECGSCHTGASLTAGGTGHFDNQVNVQGTLTGTTLTVVKHTGAPYTSSCTTSCHSAYTGSIATPTWGTVATCASCHAATPVTGSHTKHVLHTNVTCGSCHTGATAGVTGGANHFNGLIDIAANGYPASRNKGSVFASCNNITCHNGPASNPFTAPAVTWGLALNCAGCHGYPPANTNHTGVLAGTCNTCHNNVNSGGTLTNSSFQNVQLHLNGVVEGGNCDSCHGYPPVKSLTNSYGTVGRNANYSSARLQNYSGGGGVHDVAGHILPTVKESQRLGFSPCLNCHPQGATHNESAAAFGGMSTKFVQVVVDPKFKFDKNRPIVYNGNRVTGTKTTGTCANVECHFQKSPVWSSTPYGQGH